MLLDVEKTQPRYDFTATLGASITRNYTLSRSSYILLCIFGTSTDRNGIYQVMTKNDGTVIITPIKAASEANVSSSGTDSLTIKASNNGGAWVYAVVFDGSISAAT